MAKTGLDKKKMGMKAKENIYQSILWVILLLLAATMVLPFLYVVVVSFTDATVYSAGSFYLWPRKTTVFITAIGTPMSVIMNACVAYMLSKPIPGKRFFNKYVTFTMLFGAGMMPAFMNIRNLGLIDNYFAMILPGTCGAWNIMVMRSFFQSLPYELEESAKMDGCGQVRSFAVIVLPLSKAMLATMTLFSFVGYWNTYFSSVMYMTSSAKSTLQVYLQKVVLSSNISELVDLSNELANTVPQEVMRMAAVVVVVFPVLIIYPFLQKYFASGMLVGAVKG